MFRGGIGLQRAGDELRANPLGAAGGGGGEEEEEEEGGRREEVQHLAGRKERRF